MLYMENTAYRDVLMASSFGYTWNQIIYDERGEAVDYRYLEVNPAYERLLGLPEGSAAGKRVLEVFPDLRNDAFDWIGTFAQVAEEGGQSEFEAYSNQAGKWLRLSVSSSGPGFFTAFSFDITESRETENKLRASERKNRYYIEHAPDGIFITDENLRYIDVNSAGCEMLGYSRDEMLALRVGDVADIPENAAYGEHISSLLSTGRLRVNGGLRKKDGTTVRVILDSILIENGMTLTFCMDVTEQERLVREKDQYFSAFQTTPQPILITDPEGNITSVNDAFVSMYGYAREDVLGKNPNILNPGREVYENLGVGVFEYEKRFSDLWQAVADPGVKSWRGEIINRRRNGNLVWVSLLASGVYNERGKLTSIVGLPVDMTVSHELAERSRVQLYQTIADLAELRDDATGNHMKRVGLFAKLLARDYGMSQRYCDDIEVFAPMHDIGKVGILDSILRAPRALSPEEYEVMKTHTVLGHNIIKGKEEFEMAAAITLAHHEKWDGSGYPRGLAGEDIPLSARIAALVDVYDALRSRRPYKEPWTHADAADYVQGSAGTHFDPDLVRIFTNLHLRFEAVYAELSD